MLSSLYVRAFFKDRAGVLALLGVLVVVLLAILGPIFAQDAATRIDASAAGGGSSAAHWLGTDDLGRDVLARTIVATRLSLLLAISATLIAGVVGVAWGLTLASVQHPRMRAVGSNILNVVLAFPPIIVAIFIAVILGVGGRSAAIAVGVAVAPRFARVVYTLASSVSAREYVHAARVLGLSRRRVLLRHILPNVADTLWIATFLEISGALLFISALSFLGLGVQPLAFDWGSLLTSGLDNMYTTPAAVLGPAVMIVVTGLVFGFLGEAVARAGNPQRWAVTRPKRLSPRSAGGAGSEVLHEHRLAETSANEEMVLRVENLSVTIPTEDGEFCPVNQVSFEVRKGEVLGIVGESGSGKSLTAMSIAGIAPAQAQVVADRLEIAGEDQLDKPRRAGQVAMVFQDPMNSLNPALRITTQMTESLRAHRGLTAAAASLKALNALRDVHLTNPETRMRQYPHELSGGMRQRVSVAMGLVMSTPLLLADEPTTALDVTTQAQVISLLRDLRAEGMGIVIVSHDMGVIGEICDRVLVMYGGRIVERGLVEKVLTSPQHPYTQTLIDAVPDIDDDSGRWLGKTEATS
ncbi:dipeptide/oligopeptide/nickel ABC transporter permease/ATP-binding protein [Nocardioides endophyticus]|uniref:Dipeptide/oligopeptide/nickel ABC transporter permease/ATP-binding protein n=1 Tax=Nocardioides endophyticus TaxID=1353775 RepID=A0ABP8Z9C5_9ACTN